MGRVPIGADRDPSPEANLRDSSISCGSLWVGSRLGAETPSFKPRPPPQGPYTSPYPRGQYIVRFRNPANGYEEDVGTPCVWCHLFGCIYFAVRGIWTHAIAALLLVGVTAGCGMAGISIFRPARCRAALFAEGLAADIWLTTPRARLCWQTSCAPGSLGSHPHRR